MIPFTNPFRYVPHPLVRKAAREIVENLDRQIAEGKLSPEVAKGFADGKMLGVLVCEDCVLAAFSGSVGGTSSVDGFVPPIFDLTEEGGHYRTHEAGITAVNKEIERLASAELAPLAASLQEALEARDRELEELRLLKKQASGIAESQFANGEIKRAKDRWKLVISEQESKIQDVRDRIAGLRRQRAAMSDGLQRWIFSQYIVHNASGEEASVLEVFQNQGLMPPGGTGDCAAPKLLEHAFRNGLKPVAMGEFWYGRSPATAVRTHGHFYPSCTSKCGPLLGFMMQGLSVPGIRDGKTKSLPTPLGPSHSLPAAAGCSLQKPTGLFADRSRGRPWFFHPALPAPSPFTHSLKAEVIYEDEAVVVAVKPSGMPSVPGLDGRQSLQEWLIRDRACQAECIRSVHRLDMDTSGVIVYAKNAKAETDLKKQFEEHTVRKTYMARLSPADSLAVCGPSLAAGDKGSIELALSPDYDERPRQKVDHVQGKSALTGYEVVSVNEDGTTDILYYPHTGRTHQLRVHSAHVCGLGRPILGDLLYGGGGSIWSEDPICPRLHLHALSITFRHPFTGEALTFSAPLPSET